MLAAKAAGRVEADMRARPRGNASIAIVSPVRPIGGGTNDNITHVVPKVAVTSTIALRVLPSVDGTNATAWIAAQNAVTSTAIGLPVRPNVSDRWVRDLMAHVSSTADSTVPGSDMAKRTGCAAHDPMECADAIAIPTARRRAMPTMALVVGGKRARLRAMVHRAMAKMVLGVGGMTVRPAATALQTIAKKGADRGDPMARRDTMGLAERISVPMDQVDPMGRHDPIIRLARMHRTQPVRTTINPTAKPTPPFDLSLAPGERVFWSQPTRSLGCSFLARQ